MTPNSPTRAWPSTIGTESQEERAGPSRNLFSSDDYLYDEGEGEYLSMNVD